MVFDGFEVRQPLVSMVYAGFPPLVQRWNGCLPSLKSKPHPNCDVDDEGDSDDDDIIEHPWFGFETKSQQEILPTTLLASDLHDGGHYGGDDDEDDDYKSYGDDVD